jgi:hypothetical protein
LLRPGSAWSVSGRPASGYFLGILGLKISVWVQAVPRTAKTEREESPLPKLFLVRRYPLSALKVENSLLVFMEVMRRGLLELQDRKLLRLESDFSRPFVNPMFAPQQREPKTFGEVAEDYLAEVAEDARANGTSQKWVDAQRASVALLEEIVGTNLPIHEVDYGCWQWPCQNWETFPSPRCVR